MNVADINPYIRFCDIIPNPVTSSNFLKAYDCRIFYIVSGCGTFFIKDKKYNFKSDSFFFIASGTEYKFSYNISEGMKLLSINFDLTQEYSYRAKEMAPSDTLTFNPYLLIPYKFNPFLPDVLFFEIFPQVKDNLFEIFDEFIRRRSFYKEKSSSIIKNIIVELIRNIKVDSSLDIPLIVRNVSEYIKQNYQEDITGEYLGQLFGYHPYHINRMFKYYTDNTIHQYLINQRIKIAKKLLSRSELRINEIASSVGIDNQAHFTQCFKKNMGITPSAFRESMQHKTEKNL